jgi:hypothetical protein
MFIYVFWYLASYPKGRTQVNGGEEEGAEKNIFT